MRRWMKDQISTVALRMARLVVAIREGSCSGLPRASDRAQGRRGDWCDADVHAILARWVEHQCNDSRVFPSSMFLFLSSLLTLFTNFDSSSLEREKIKEIISHTHTLEQSLSIPTFPRNNEKMEPIIEVSESPPTLAAPPPLLLTTAATPTQLPATTQPTNSTASQPLVSNSSSAPESYSFTPNSPEPMHFQTSASEPDTQPVVAGSISLLPWFQDPSTNHATAPACSTSRELD